jgi:hypothetical protein
MHELIRFSVPDYPPAKDGGISVFGETHLHAPRLRALLTAAQQALKSYPDFVPLSDGAIGLELLVYADPSDPSKGRCHELSRPGCRRTRRQEQRRCGDRGTWAS